MLPGVQAVAEGIVQPGAPQRRVMVPLPRICSTTQSRSSPQSVRWPGERLRETRIRVGRIADGGFDELPESEHGSLRRRIAAPWSGVTT